MNPDELIKRVDELIAKLKTLSGQSGATGRSMENMESQIAKIASGLGQLNSGITFKSLDAQLVKLETQLLNIGNGANLTQERIRLMGQKINLNPFSSATKGITPPITPTGTLLTGTQPSIFSAPAQTTPSPSFGTPAVVTPTTPTTVPTTVPTNQATTAPSGTFGMNQVLAGQWSIIKGSEKDQSKALDRLQKLINDERKALDGIAKAEQDAWSIRNKQALAQEAEELKRIEELKKIQDDAIAELQKRADAFDKAEKEVADRQRKELADIQKEADRVNREVDKKVAAENKAIVKQGLLEDTKKEASIIKENQAQEADKQRLIKLGEATLAAEEALLAEHEQMVARKSSLQAEELLLAKQKESPFAGTQLETVPGAQNALNLAQKIDPKFDMSTLKKVTTEGSTGISRLNFQYENMDKTIRQLSVTLDKFGRPLVDTQKRFRSFADNLMRDVQEVFKWTIAVSLIYGPMQKLGQVMTDMVTIETQLADVQVTLAKSSREINTVWSSAYDIAQQTGEGVVGVVEAYNLAYRAAGGAATETERFTLANTLLKDAIILSKLSTLSQAESIDTLSAALKQSGYSLAEGSILLDKWVRTTKVANVDLTALATGFSVVGDAADTAGVGVDKLNAIIATVAETSGSAPKELANTVKALIGGFQSDQAQVALNRLGISVVDTSGKMRGFVDIMQQLYDLRKSGQLGDTDFSKLTLALGGGTRRQASYTTLIENFGKVADIEKQSMNASGDSAEAITIKLDTVQTSLEKLNNAFQGLSQTLATDGGLLDIFKLLVDGSTILAEALSKVFQMLGKAGPLLIAVAGSMAYLNSSKNSGYKSSLITNVSDLIARTTRPSPKEMANGRLTALQTSGDPYFDPIVSNGQRSQQISAFLQKSNRFGVSNAGLIGGAGATAFSAVQNLASGDTGKAIGVTIGGSIGTVLGGPVGAAVGIAISESFYNATIGHKDDFADLFAPTSRKEVTKLDASAKPEAVKEFALQELYKGVGLGNYELGKVIASIDQAVSIAVGSVQNLMGKNGISTLTQAQGAERELASMLSVGMISQQKYDEIIGYLRDGVAVNVLSNPENDPNVQNTKLTNEGITNLVSQEYNKKLKQDFYSGDITRKQYLEGKSSLTGLGTSGAIWSNALQGAMGPDQQIYEKFGKIKAYGSDIGINEINSIANEIQSVVKKQAEVKGSDYAGSRGLVIGLQQQETELRKQLIEAINQETKAIDEETISRTKNLGIGNYDMPTAEFDRLIGINNNAPDFQKYLDQWQATGVTLNPEDLAIQTSDQILRVNNKDWKLVQMYLSEILKVNQKQLDGLYNLPEGSSFWIPYQASKYGLKDTNVPTNTDTHVGADLSLGNTDTGKTNTPGVGTNNVPSTVQDIIDQSSLNADSSTILLPQWYKDMMKEKSTPPQGVNNVPSYIQDIIDQSRSSLNSIPPSTMTGPYSVTDFSALTGIIEAIKNLSANLKITIDNRQTIMVDGKVLAEVVSKQLQDKLVKFGGSVGAEQRLAMM